MTALLWILLELISLAVVVTTLLPFVRKGYWWVRVWDFPRAQIVAIGAVTALGLAALGPSTWPAGLVLAALAAATAYQAYRIYRFTPLAPTQVLKSAAPRSDRRIRLLISNVLVENRDSRRLLDLIEATDPDIVVAMEPDAFWAGELARLHRNFPYRLERPQDNAYGMMLFSRLELRDAEIRFLMDEDVPSFRARVVLRSGDTVMFYALHPRPPMTLQPTFDRDAELLLVGREIRQSGEPTLVAGDLNDVAWSYTTRLFQRLSGLMDPRLGRGLYSTFHAHRPLMRWPLDHVFFDPEFRLVRLERQRDIGSDHFPILVELSFEPEGADEQEPRTQMPGDRAEARRLIRDGRQHQSAG